MNYISAFFLILNASNLFAAAFEPRFGDETDRFFDSNRVVELRFKVSPADIDAINREDRPYVSADLIEDNQKTYQQLSIKLKGAAGSFRNFDDRPALTIKTNRTKKDQTFHGLFKFHLNNSVQDESYLNEFICASIFASAQYPATRVSYARVWLNDRDVGLYVLKEGFDARFLADHFQKPIGNLYDGGFLQDIDVDLEKDDGDGPDDHSDLHKIANAARQQQPQQRWSELAEVVDIDRFLTFMALERMTSHWDGYCLNANNYRVYMDSRTRKSVFLPHGMDQMFGDPGMSLWYHPHPQISRAIMQNDAWRTMYRQRVEQLLPKLDPEVLGKKIAAVQSGLQPVLRAISQEQANHQAELAKELLQRIEERFTNIKDQLQQPDPAPESFDTSNELTLRDWYPVVEAGQGKLEVVEQVQGESVKSYAIAFEADPPMVASWRRSVLLSPGKYRFSARTMLNEYQAAENEPTGFRLLNNLFPVEHVQNDSGRWTTQVIEFELLEDRVELEFVLEIRASRGSGYIDCDKTILERLPKSK